MTASAAALDAAPTGPQAPAPPRRQRPWLPKRLLVTASAQEHPHAHEVVARATAAGVQDVQLLCSDRLPSLRGADERATYALAKSTLAVVTSPPSSAKLEPIAPSADWRLDLARGCPAHCQYCYLAGSLAGPPVTRVYADLPHVLSAMDPHVGAGAVTSGTAARGHEGTTFEASCYTDPLGLEHLTGSLSAAVRHVGSHDFGGPVQLRFTTKYADVEPLLGLPHAGRTRVRASVNAEAVARRYEGGTAAVAQRLGGLRALALDGYPVGLTIAPIMPVEGWREAYAALLRDAAAALADVPGLDLTAELITHRFTPKSREVLLGWYPRTQLEMDADARRAKRGRFGALKHVYPEPVMTELRTWFERELTAVLPQARVLYWT